VDLPILSGMRSTLLRALWFPLLLGIATSGCRRPGSCPEGQEETKVSSGDAYWCRDLAKKTGQYIQLHPGTRVWRQRCSFQDGVLQGPFEAAHPGGQRWVQGQYQGGRLSGRWVQWNPTGQKVAEGQYREGRLISGAPVAVAAICETIPHLQ
jgi:hypothetical protein